MTQKQLKQLREKKILTAVMAVLVAISGYCAYNIITILQEYHESEMEYKSIIDDVIVNADTVELEDHTKDAYLIVDHDKLSARNSDYVGWIRIPDSNVNYPVVRATDNDWYLIRSFEGSWNGSGSIFMDFENAADWSDFHTIIYGHHMKNQTMFWYLNQFRYQDVWDSHRTVEIYRSGKVYIYEIFSFYKAQADDDTYKVKFSSDQQSSDWLSFVTSSSMYN